MSLAKFLKKQLQRKEQEKRKQVNERSKRALERT